MKAEVIGRSGGTLSRRLSPGLGHWGCLLPSRDDEMEVILRVVRHQPFSKRVHNEGERLAVRFLFLWGSGRRKD